MNTRKQQQIWTKDFISISMTQLVVFTVFYALMTTLPLYVMNNLDGSTADGGLVITVITASAILIRLFSAKFLDKLGKKRGLVIGAIAYTLTTFVYIWMKALTPLLILRFIHGISFGFITTATGAIVANIVPKERHGEGIGYFAMSGSIAVVLGPFAGLTFIQYVSFETLFIILSIITLGAILFASLVQEQKVEKGSAVEQKAQKLTVKDFIETRALPVSFIAALFTFAYASITTFLSVYAESIELLKAANYFFLIYATAMLVSRPYFGRRFDRLGPNQAILPGFILFALGLTFLSVTKTAWMLLFSAFVIGLGFGTLTPSFQTLAIQSTTPSRSGHATATFFTFFDIGIAIGSYILGLIVSQYSFQVMYIVCVIIIIASMGLYLIVRPSRKNIIVSEHKRR